MAGSEGSQGPGGRKQGRDGDSETFTCRDPLEGEGLPSQGPTPLSNGQPETLILAYKSTPTFQAAIYCDMRSTLTF